PEERDSLMAAVQLARSAIEQRHQPHGYNIGIDVGEAAGQTVFHLHVHIIPRHWGDVREPRGGVRHVIPARADYVGMSREAQRDYVVRVHDPLHDLARLPHRRPVVVGGEDPLLPHLRAHLTAALALDVGVAFVLERGFVLVEEYMKDLIRRGGRLRFLTGDYLDITEPAALRRLIDLGTIATESTGIVDLRIFESAGQSFHPKTYILHLADGDGVAFV